MEWPQELAKDSVSLESTETRSCWIDGSSRRVVGPAYYDQGEHQGEPCRAGSDKEQAEREDDIQGKREWEKEDDMVDMEARREVEKGRKWEEEEEGRREVVKAEEQQVLVVLLGKTQARNQNNTAARRLAREVASLLLVVVCVVLVGNCRELAAMSSRRQSCFHARLHVPPQMSLLHALVQSIYAACDAASDSLRFCLA